MAGIANSEFVARFNSNSIDNIVLRQRRAWQLYLIAVIAYGLIFGFFQVEAVPLSVHFIGILIAAVCFLPIRSWHAENKATLPMFELICLTYLLQYGTPVYHQRNMIIIRGEETFLSWEAVFNTLVLTLVGMASMIACYKWIAGSGVKKLIPKINLSLSSQAQYSYVLLAGTTGFILFFLRTIAPESLGTMTEYGAFISLLTNQIYVAIAILAYQVYLGGEKEKRKASRALLYGAITVAMLLGIATGGLENTLVPLVIFFAVRWECTKKFPWKTMLGCALIFIVLQPVKSAYRTQTWNNTTGSQSYSEQISLWVTLTNDYLTSPKDIGMVSDDMLQSLGRFDLHHQFVNAQSLTPAVIPYYRGKTYEYLLYGWIPRFLWKDKPIAQESNKTLAVDYGLLFESQIDSTMTGVGHLTESYINFGASGVVIIMGLFGFIFGGLSLFLNHQESQAGKAIYLSIMVFLLNGIGSNTAGLLGGLLQYILACWVIMKIFELVFHQKTSPQIKFSP